MSEPDNPRWLEQLNGELREEVVVRPAWRARLLDEIARSPRPLVGGPDAPDVSMPSTDLDDIAPPRRSHQFRRGRRIVLPPIVGLAAALAFAAVGAGAMLAVMSLRGSDTASSRSAQDVSSTDDASAALPVANPGAERSVVRFELSAPTASRVALVGSFNRWNPIATPLERDPATGKWVVALQLPAGRHVYAFVVDGDVTADPAAPRAADADFGSANSVVLVSGRSS